MAKGEFCGCHGDGSVVLKRDGLFGREKHSFWTLASRCICSQALFSVLFGENVGATWLYTRAQFHTTKQIIDKVDQDSLSHFDYKISEIV